MKISHIKVFITCSYIPPQSDLLIYQQHIALIKMVSLKTNPDDLIFVIGDFNLPRISWQFSTENYNYIPIRSDENGADVFYNISNLCLHQINGVYNICSNLLDLVFVNVPNECTVNRVDPVTLPEDRYHPTIEISCNIQGLDCAKNVTKKEKNFCFQRTNYADFNNLLYNTNWLQLLSIPNGLPNPVDKMIKIFYETMYQYMDECIPKISPRSQNGPPWNSKQLSSLKNLKNKYYKKYKKYGHAFDYRKYSVLRAEHNLLNAQLYKNYLTKMKHSFKHNPRSFFTFVNSKRKNCGTPTFMKDLSTESSNESEISNLFAEFFASTYSNAEFDDDEPYPFNVHSTQTISIPLLDTTHIIKCLKNFKSSMSCGPDGIPSCLLKNCALAIATPLVIIFNTSLKYGYFPKIWKESFLIPLFKSGNKSNIINYRGIAKLNAIPKLFEKCITDSLVHQVSPLLTPCQHGFRKGSSAMTNILQLTTLVNEGFTSGQQTDVIYTDFSKAFDKVNHKLLLKKLDKMGFDNTYLSWLKSYLICRTQSVKFNSANSRNILVKSGVPQGSHLGPILFLLFINDLPEAINYSNILMFADDVKIFLSLKHSPDHSYLQKDLENFYNWCYINLMELNLKKCKHMTFSRRLDAVGHYYISGHKLESVSVIMDLGVLLDGKLNFVQHITMAVNKARGIWAFIKRWAKEFKDPFITKRLFTSLVRPILEYGSIVWDPYYNVHINLIESVQKQFLIFCLRDVYRGYSALPSYSSRLALIRLPTLKSRRIMLNVSFLVNLLNGNVSSNFLLSKISLNVPQRTLRFNHPLYVKTFRTNYEMADPFRKLCCCFNEMFNFIDFSLNIYVIKRNIILSLNV